MLLDLRHFCWIEIATRRAMGQSQRAEVEQPQAPQHIAFAVLTLAQAEIVHRPFTVHYFVRQALDCFDESYMRHPRPKHFKSSAYRDLGQTYSCEDRQGAR